MTCIRPGIQQLCTSLNVQCHGLRFCVICMFLLPCLRVSNTKTFTENFPDSFQRHALALWVEEDNEQPTNKGNSGVETKGAGGRPALHHGKEGRCNNNIRAPACHCVLFNKSASKSRD